jgi:hypothetical protein
MSSFSALTRALEVRKRALNREPERAVYHRQAVFHLNGNGQRLRLPANATVWVLGMSPWTSVLRHR